MMMNDDQPVGGIYVYRGGRAPNNITHAIIDKSVKVIDERAFRNNPFLHTVEMHDGIDRVREEAFHLCHSLLYVNLRRIKILDSFAFANSGLTHVDGDDLEIIRDNAFQGCDNLKKIAFSSLRVIEPCAFEDTDLRELNLPEVEQIGVCAFVSNSHLRRIAIPLKANLFFIDPLTDGSEIVDTAFSGCHINHVDLIGGIHETVSSLHMESWRNDMTHEINQINKTLENSYSSKHNTAVIRWWLQSVCSRIEHYKTEHLKVLKAATVLLELALWKAKLSEKDEDESSDCAKVKRIKIDVEDARSEARGSCGAGMNIIIKNVLPFLELK
mmetsp:Transcript_13483/g.21007  ORF Transcript_13483/g.21007 Transcript_13483/m.21007 type:complete len:327 (+) Transcript_13483:90-1070(+)